MRGNKGKFSGDGQNDFFQEGAKSGEFSFYQLGK